MFTAYFNLTLLTAMLPFIFASLATTLAGLLSQDKWADGVNDLIATIFVLAASVADVYVTGKLTDNIALIVATVTATATALLATSFVPLQTWTSFLRQTILVIQDSGFHVVAQPTNTPTQSTQDTSDTPKVFAIGYDDDETPPSTPIINPADGTTEIPKTQFKQPPPTA